jgi:hypothetical protein
MNTPEWFGSVGVMNGAHMHRRGLVAWFRQVLGGLRAAAAGLRFPRGLLSPRGNRLQTRRGRQVLAE